MRTVAADGPYAMFASDEPYRPPKIKDLGDAIEHTQRSPAPKQPPEFAAVVKVSDLVSGSLKWGLGILSAVIVLGIGTLVSQTIARSKQLEDTQRQLEIANTNHANLQQFIAQRFADQQRQIDALQRQLEQAEEQVRLLWRR